MSSVDWDSGTGFFDKLGKVVKLVNSLDTFETGTFDTNFDELRAEMEAADIDATALIDARRATMEREFLSHRQAIARELVLPLLITEIAEIENLTVRTTAGLLSEVARLMDEDSETIESIAYGGTGSPTPPASDNFGGGAAYSQNASSTPDTPAGEVSELTAIKNQIAVSQEWTLVCISDASTGARNGAEIWRLEGTGPVRPAGAPGLLWITEGNPGTVKAISDVGDTKLTNGGFGSYNSDGSPAGWTFVSGRQNVLKEAHVGYRNGSCLRILDGCHFYQDVTGIKPLTKYVLSFVVQRKEDPGGLLNVRPSFSVDEHNWLDLTSGGGLPSPGTWVRQSIFFNSKQSLPATLRISVDRTTVNAAHESNWILLDQLTLTEVKGFNGIHPAVFAGTDLDVDKAVIGNRFDWTAPATTPGVFQTFFRRFFKQVLPFAASPTISDTLAT